LISPFTHTYTAPGIYNVTMSVTDKNGCKDSTTKLNYIKPTYPYPAYTVNHFSCKGNLLTFNASATNAVGPTYTWDFGDGTTSTSHNAITTHTYIKDSLYHIQLIVQDTNGCDSTMKKDTVLILKPTASFTTFAPNPQCRNSVVYFHSTSTGYPTSFFWTFGDGATSNSLDSCSHTYTQPGTYNVSLIVTNPGGCTDTTKQDSIVVVPGPIGNFTFSPVSGCNPLAVTFIAHSSNAQYYSWDFGDGAIAPMQTNDSIVHIYNQQGAFTPNLVLINTVNSGLCPFATSTVGVVTTINSINVSLTPPVITLPQDSSGHVTANASGGNGPYTYSWSPNDNINCTTCANIIVTGTGDTLVYALTTHDKNGCVAVTNLLVISKPCIESALIPNIFTPNGDGKNDVFFIPGVCPDDNYSLQIFDRWGNTLFSSQQRNNVWDGKTPNGADATDGVYYFIVNLSKTSYKGFVNLVR
ncbi:MAG TPA: PKD domain-containing protein, partial [Bacteroidia bacterium]|nr:PKD domain-containing protein [Bacteroidia bacterium]